MRFYDPELGRFVTQDPARDGWNWYQYANSNPLRFIDALGLAAGDLFKSMEEAALDFAITYNDDTIRNTREYGAAIYETRDADGNTRYSYTVPRMGSEDGVTGSWPRAGLKPVAAIHTHPYIPDYINKKGIGVRHYPEEFSRQDKEYASDRKVSSFIVTPSGRLVFRDRSNYWKECEILDSRIASDPSLGDARKTDVDPSDGKDDPTQSLGARLKDFFYNLFH